MSYNQGGFGGPVGFNSAPQNNFGQDDSFDAIDLDLSSFDPNAEPWEIAQQLSGGERDIGSGQDLHNAFNQAYNMPVNVDINSARDMFNEASTTSRGGGKTNFSTKLIAGAAGWAAMSYYQSYQKKQGHKVNHAFLKKMVAGIAMAQAVKMYNKQSSKKTFMGMGGKRDVDPTRDAVAAEAAANAMKLCDDQFGAENQNNQYGGQNNQYGGQNNQYGNQPPMGNFPSGGYGGPPPGQDYKDPYGGSSNNFNHGPPGGYGAPAPVQNFNGPPGGYSGPQPPNPGGYNSGSGNFPPSGYGGGPPTMPNGPPTGFHQPPGPNNFNQPPGGPPPYNPAPGPGGFFNPNMPKY